MDLNEKMRRLDKVMVQMRYVATYFSTTTANFFEGIIHDMNSRHEKKKAAVSVALASIQEDTHRMNSLIFETNYLVSNDRHVDFLDKYPRLIKQAEYLYFKKHEGRAKLTLALKIDPEVYDDVPNALDDIKHSRDQCEFFKHQLHVINCLFKPIAQRRIQARNFEEITISPHIMKNLERELE